MPLSSLTVSSLLQKESQNGEHAYEPKLVRHIGGKQDRTEDKKKAIQQTTSPNFNFPTHTHVGFASLYTMQWLRVTLPCTHTWLEV